MRGGYVRGAAEHVEGSKVRYRWPCGHATVKDHSKGPASKRFGEWAARFYVRYWSRSGGVNLPPCKRCKQRKP